MDGLEVTYLRRLGLCARDVGFEIGRHSFPGPRSKRDPSPAMRGIAEMDLDGLQVRLCLRAAHHQQLANAQTSSSRNASPEVVMHSRHGGELRTGVPCRNMQKLKLVRGASRCDRSLSPITSRMPALILVDGLGGDGFGEPTPSAS